MLEAQWILDNISNPGIVAALLFMGISVVTIEYRVTNKRLLDNQTKALERCEARGVDERKMHQHFVRQVFERLKIDVGDEN